MQKVKIYLVALSFLFLTASTAKAEIYLEGYIGGNFPACTSSTLSMAYIPTGYTFNPGFGPSQVDPSFLGGVKIGTWFVKEGFLGFNYPEWMKYFGFYLDLSYHHLDFAQRTATGTAVDRYFVVPFPYLFQSKR